MSGNRRVALVVAVAVSSTLLLALKAASSSPRETNTSVTLQPSTERGGKQNTVNGDTAPEISPKRAENSPLNHRQVETSRLGVGGIVFMVFVGGMLAFVLLRCKTVMDSKSKKKRPTSPVTDLPAGRTFRCDSNEGSTSTKAGLHADCERDDQSHFHSPDSRDSTRADSPALSITSTTSTVRSALAALPSDNAGWTVLHIAASTNAVESLRRFLRSSSSAVASKVNVCDKRLRTAAHVAAECDHCGALELLIDAGADIAALRDERHRTVVTVAVELGMRNKWNCLRSILHRFHSVNSGQAARMRAELLAWRGPSPRMSALAAATDAGPQERSVLAFACSSPAADDIAQMLIAMLPELAFLRDNEGRTPLHNAAEFGVSGALRALAALSPLGGEQQSNSRNGSLLLATDRRGVLPAHLAAASGVLAVAEFVIETTAQLGLHMASLKDHSGWNAQVYAVRALQRSPSAQQAEIVALLERHSCPRKEAETQLL